MGNTSCGFVMCVGGIKGGRIYGGEVKRRRDGEGGGGAAGVAGIDFEEEASKLHMHRRRRTLGE